MSNLPKNLMNIEYKDLSPLHQRDLIKEISKPKGFFKLYFNNLPYARTCIECFNKINDLHFSIHGDYMYSHYNSFSKQYGRYLKK